MTVFLLDLWNDLKEKRLWPVALALLVGLIAVPFVLAKPAPEEGSASSPLVRQSKAPGGPAVQLASGERGSSGLGAFDRKNPFKSGIKPPKGLDGTSFSSIAKSLLAGTGADSLAGSGGGAASGGSSSGGALPGTGTTGGGTTGGGTTGGGIKKTVRYTYVVDATLSRAGSSRTIKGMRRLTMLPSEASPLLLFLGVDAKAGDAVFLVDATVKTSGEGSCRPSGSACAMLYLGAGSEQLFTDEAGRRYVLRIDQIRQVRVGAARASASKSSTGARAARSSRSGVRRFAPLLIDLVTVARDGDGDSNRNRDRR